VTVSAPRKHRIAEVLRRALEIEDRKVRSGFLDMACRDDPALRDEIESILKREGESPDFLEDGWFPETFGLHRTRWTLD
jgi:hypothetical protein